MKKLKIIMHGCLLLSTLLLQSQLTAKPATLSLQVNDFDRQCGIGLQATVENTALVLHVAAPKQNSASQIEYHFFVTRDGFERRPGKPSYERHITTKTRFLVNTGKLQPWLDFGTLIVAVEAIDQSGVIGYATTQVIVNRPFVYVRDRQSSRNCVRIGSGEVLSGLYRNSSSASRVIAFEDTHVDSLSDSASHRNGLYGSSDPSVGGFSLFNYSRHSKNVRERFSLTRLTQINRVYKTLASNDNGVIVRRLKTFYNAYNVYSNDRCGVMTKVSNALLETTAPHYRLALIDDTEGDFIAEIGEDVLAKTMNTCSDDVLRGQRIF